MSQETANPTLYVIAGPNGAGKTTFARDLPSDITRMQAVRERRPDRPGVVAVRTGDGRPEGRAADAGTASMTCRGNGSISAWKPPCPAGPMRRWFRRLKAEGYRIHLFFLWLPEVDMAVARVADRVRRGGHRVPEEDVRRRYSAGSAQLRTSLPPLARGWILFDNTGKTPIIIAEADGGRLEIRDADRHARFLAGSRCDE